MGVYGSKPDMSKTVAQGRAGTVAVHVSMTKGWRRVLEDVFHVQFDVLPSTHFIGLFDGHGGSEVAEFCKAMMPSHLAKNQKMIAGQWAEGIQEVFLEMDALMASPEGQALMDSIHKGSASPNKNGASAGVLLVREEQVVVASLGKCQVWASRKGQSPALLSLYHDFREKEERARVKAAGGWVSEGRVNDNLTMSRSLGVLDYKSNPKLEPLSQIVIAKPEVLVLPVEPDLEFLMMTSDGTFEILTPEFAVEHIRKALATGQDLAGVLNFILDNGYGQDTVTGDGCNNMTLMVVTFHQPPFPGNSLTIGHVQEPKPEEPLVRKKSAKEVAQEVEELRHSHDHGI